MLDARRLLVLREVAAHGSVSGAADALGYTPSAVSQQLAAFERETGSALIERSGRGIRLTQAAHLLLPHAHDVLAALERADAALARTDLVGSVRLASFPTATRALLPRPLVALRARHPDLRIDLTELEPHESLPALAVGRIDIAVAHEYDLISRDPARDLRRAEILREPVMLVGARDGRPAAGRAAEAQVAPRARVAAPARLADFADADWIAPPADTSCGELVRRACASAGFTPRVVAETGDFSVAAALAEAGLGVALVPRLGGEGRPLDPPIERRIFVASRAGSEDHPLIRAVIDAIASS
jgi:DNA-binding transcriptional LysR family regulator